MTYLGMWCLGAFVGTVLVLGLEYFKDKSSYLQLSVAILAAALSGTVVGFFDYLARQGPNPGLFAYPIGLLIAVIWYYVSHALDNIRRVEGSSKLLGWLHLLGVITATVLTGIVVLLPAIADIRAYEPGSVHTCHLNGYELEFDGIMRQLDASEKSFRVARNSGTISVGEGKLWIDDKDYGPVQVGDRISVVNGKVSVNGATRKPGGA